MKIMREEQNWYRSGGCAPHFQVLIIDEDTGATVAVTYNDEGGHKARLLAAAPKLLAALAAIYDLTTDDTGGRTIPAGCFTDAILAMAEAGWWHRTSTMLVTAKQGS